MAKCKHEIPDLMGTADGILCRRCGSLFKTFDELYADAGTAKAEPAEAQETAQEEPKPAVKRGRKKKGE